MSHNILLRSMKTCNIPFCYLISGNTFHLKKKEKKMSSNVPNEIYRNIFGFIDKNDTKTLYSGLLVNRIWCMNMVPLIWKRPFNISINHEKLVPIFLSFLNDETKEFLQIQDRNLNIPYKVSFDYPYFIKEIHFGRIHLSVKKWIEEDRMIGPTLSDDYFIEMILNVIINKCESIERIQLDTRDEYEPINLNFYQPLLTSTPK